MIWNKTPVGLRLRHGGDSCAGVQHVASDDVWMQGCEVRSGADRRSLSRAAYLASNV
jgi:hypothetical protein